MAHRASDRAAPRGPRRFRGTAFAGLLAAAAAAANAQPVFGVVDGPLNLLADVTEATSTRGIVFSDNQRVLGTVAGPKQTAEYLYLVPPPTINRSGRGQGPERGFASSLAESDGNGGVGVSAFHFGRPAGTGIAGYGELASQAVWTQTFEHTGGPAPAAAISLHLEIPAVEVALYGVGPRRSAVSATETAQAIATVSTFVTRADGSTSEASSFEYGLRAFELQLPLGPGVFSNVGIAVPIGSLGGNITEGGDSFSPTWTLAARSFDVPLGTLDAGDRLTYIYTLAAIGSTNGGERG